MLNFDPEWYRQNWRKIAVAVVAAVIIGAVLF